METNVILLTCQTRPSHDLSTDNKSSRRSPDLSRHSPDLSSDITYRYNRPFSSLPLKKRMVMRYESENKIIPLDSSKLKSTTTWKEICAELFIYIEETAVQYGIYHKNIFYIRCDNSLFDYVYHHCWFIIGQKCGYKDYMRMKK